VVERPSWAGVGALMQDAVEHQRDQCVDVLLVGLACPALAPHITCKPIVGPRASPLSRLGRRLVEPGTCSATLALARTCTHLATAFVLCIQVGLPPPPSGMPVSQKRILPRRNRLVARSSTGCCACGLRYAGRALSGGSNVVELACWSALMPRLFRPLSALCLLLMGPFCTV
jgi:hypothetical protein